MPPAVSPGKKFHSTFWLLNSIEMWERLAFYNLRVMAPIYIMQADNPGGLYLTAQDKGIIYAWWAILQSLLPSSPEGWHGCGRRPRQSPNPRGTATPGQSEHNPSSPAAYRCA